MDRLDDLRAKWHAASEKGRHADAVKALVELERLVPDDPLWSQRLGEAYRRGGQGSEAVGAFVRAFERYIDRGFLPRAIAMAKLVKTLDAARGDFLEAHLARASGRKASTPGMPAVQHRVRDDSEVVPTPKAPRTAHGIPEPAEPAPFALAGGEHRLVVPVRAAVLAPAADSGGDEVRFDDASASSMTFSLGDVSGLDLTDDALPLDDDDDAPPTRPLGEHETRAKARQDAYAAMASFRLFASLSPDALLALANASELVEFIPNAMIIVRDERAYALYAIVSGSARVTVAGSETSHRLVEGDVFGESSVLDDGQRQATVKAETALMTLRIEKHALDDVTREYPEVEDALFDLLARRLVSNLVSTSPLFAPFEPPVRLELAQAFEVRRAAPGTLIAESGRRSDGLYVLLAGHLTSQSSGGIPARIARGTAFGHASLLGAGTADTTIRAITESVVLRMPASKFTEVAAHYPPVLAYLAETAHEPLPVSQRDLG